MLQIVVGKMTIDFIVFPFHRYSHVNPLSYDFNNYLFK